MVEMADESFLCVGCGHGCTHPVTLSFVEQESLYSIHILVGRRKKLIKVIVLYGVNCKLH